MNKSAWPLKEVEPPCPLLLPTATCVYSRFEANCCLQILTQRFHRHLHLFPRPVAPPLKPQYFLQSTNIGIESQFHCPSCQLIGYYSPLAPAASAAIMLIPVMSTVHMSVASLNPNLTARFFACQWRPCDLGCCSRTVVVIKAAANPCLRNCQTSVSIGTHWPGQYMPIFHGNALNALF